MRSLNPHLLDLRRIETLSRVQGPQAVPILSPSAAYSRAGRG